MGAAKLISQEAFDEAVKANVDDFDMEPEEAVKAAVEEFQIQKVDLSGINQTFYAERTEHPMVAAMPRLEEALGGQEAGEVLAVVRELLADKSRGEAFTAEALAVSSQKGLVSTLLGALPKLQEADEGLVVEGLQTLTAALVTDPHREAFHKNGGTAAMLALLAGAAPAGALPAAAYTTTAQACFKNEDNKASFIAQGGDDAMLRTLREEGADAATLVATCTTLRSVTVADDDRPCLTSGAFKSAREICSKGAASALLAVLRRALEEGSAPLAAAGCSALRRVSVTDEICQGIADDGGVELLLALSEAHADNAAVTRTAMSVMRQLANSDANKNLIIRRGGLRAVQAVAATGVPGSCEQALGLIVGLTLRNPDGATAAVEAGCVDTITAVMGALPGEQWVQRQGCMAVRNLVSRTPEHKAAFLAAGAEDLLRAAQLAHPQACKDVGGAALRDLGFEDYDLGLDLNED